MTNGTISFLVTPLTRLWRCRPHPRRYGQATLWPAHGPFGAMVASLPIWEMHVPHPDPLGVGVALKYEGAPSRSAAATHCPEGAVAAWRPYLRPQTSYPEGAEAPVQRQQIVFVDEG